MIKNSRKRILARQTSALLRRKANIINYNQRLTEGAYTTEGQIATVKNRIAIAETDIANLQKKGVRV